MPLIIGSLKWYTVAERLRAAVHTALTTAPERSGVVPGRIAWDACDCGILAVSVGAVYLSDNFPVPQPADPGGCGAAWEVGEIIIQIIRCAPSPQGQDLHPTVAALDACARLVAVDAYETLKAAAETLCRMEEDREIIDQLLRTQVPQGPEGGCVGTELRALVALPRM